MYACSPTWEANWISESDLYQLLSSLAGHIVPSPWGKERVSLSHGVHFTGGEPFLNFKLLVSATQMATELGIPSTFVETNCSWCVNDDVTRERLEALRQAGLKGIMISVNPFYVEYIPFERTERCIRISQEVFGPNVMIYQIEFYRQFKRLDLQGKVPFERYLKLVRTLDGGVGVAVEMFLMGRAARALKPYYRSYPAATFFGEPCQPPFLRDWHNHFDNYGNFMPGFCGGISLGSWRELDRLIREGIDVRDYPVLRSLIAEDIRALFYFAREHGYQEVPQGYISKCDLCLDIRLHLVQHGNFAELSPRAFYEQLAREEILQHEDQRNAGGQHPKVGSQQT
ncbi:MAG: radical SAM protein [Anaerolineae bacterium]|nr:radical SAM protein [Anaerolineae bacterium]MDW8070443.1 radical SAM protein [Anaerolineae bacterium]